MIERFNGSVMTKLRQQALEYVRKHLNPVSDAVIYGDTGVYELDLVAIAPDARMRSNYNNYFRSEFPPDSEEMGLPPSTSKLETKFIRLFLRHHLLRFIKDCNRVRMGLETGKRVITRLSTDITLRRAPLVLGIRPGKEQLERGNQYMALLHLCVRHNVVSYLDLDEPLWSPH